MDYSPAPLLGVPEGSAAAEAGLETFDRVVAVNGQAVPNVAALSRALASAGPKVDLKVLRLESLGYPGVGLSNPKTLFLTVEKQEGAGLAALGESTRLLLGYGVDRIAERLLAITDLACARLAAIGASIASCREGDRSSGIVSFDLPGIELATIRRRCLEQGVVLNVRGGRLRISPHAYSNEEDVDRLVAALRGAISEG